MTACIMAGRVDLTNWVLINAVMIRWIMDRLMIGMIMTGWIIPIWILINHVAIGQIRIDQIMSGHAMLDCITVGRCPVHRNIVPMPLGTQMLSPARLSNGCTT